MLFLIGFNWPVFHSLYKKIQGQSEKNSGEKQFSGVPIFPVKGKLEWQRLKFLSRWKYPQQSLRLCHTLLNQTQTQQTATKK